VGLDSSREILSKSVTDLQKILRIDSVAANTILSAASSEAYDWRIREKTGHELIQDTQTLTTGDSTIDRVLNGGIYLGMLTEIVGER
jgi:RecA/RadA recombinase